MRASISFACVLVSLTACSLSVDYTGTYYECGENDTCPDGYVCKQQVCIPTEPDPTTCTAAVSMGFEHACAIRDTDGSVWCWGSNNSGQLGNNTTTDSTIPVQVEGLLGATAIATGADFSCAVLGADRSVQCWGGNDNGQLGDGSTSGSRTPVQAGTLTGVSQLVVGDEHACALQDSGAVSCWGANDFGQLGDGTQASHRSPAPVPGVTATFIAATEDSSCAVTGSELTCWGENSSGMFMNGTTDDPASPVTSTMVAEVAQVAIGGDHLCVLSNQGQMSCAGENDEGELGIGTAGADVPTPNIVDIPVQITAMSLGRNSTCALDALGTVWCWGNDDGRLGTGRDDFNFVTLPVRTEFQDVESISASRNDTCVRLNSGAIECAGFNHHGERGLGFRTSQASAQLVPDLENVVQVASGGDFSCALDMDGVVKCWGNGNEGELGDGTLQVRPVVGTSLATNIATLASGDDHVCGITTAGTIKCWGRGSSGELGTGLQTSSGVPFEIPGLTGVTALSLGDSSTCAMVAGTAMCWGGNTGGMLGGGANPLLAPTAVPNIIDAPASAVAVGSRNACVIDALKEVQCFGANDFGQLANGDDLVTTTPAKVTIPGATPLENVDEIATRGSSVFARSGGQIFAWGYGCDHRLGSTSAGSCDTLRAVPVADIDNAAKLAIGDSSSCALRTDGSVACWGEAYIGQLGDGTYSGKDPVPIVGLTGILDISAGGEHVCAVQADHTVVCWGGDYNGQLGDNVLQDVDPSFVRMPCE